MNRERPDRGFALIAVLWFSAFFALLLVSVRLLVHSDLELARAVAERAKADALAQAGIVEAVAVLSRTHPMESWPLDGSERNLTLDTGTVAIAVTDEAGRIDLNSASAETLAALLQRIAGLTAEGANARAAAIVDWRDADDDPMFGVSERDLYSGTTLMPPRNAALAAPEELTQVLGFTPLLAARLQPYVTTYTGLAATDAETSPRAITDLGLAEPATAPRAGAQRLSRANTYRIRVEAKSNGGGRSFQEAVVRLTGNAAEPYWILHTEALRDADARNCVSRLTGIAKLRIGRCRGYEGRSELLPESVRPGTREEFSVYGIDF